MFVTDTHPFVWYATGKHTQLSRKVISELEKADKSESLIYIPAVVIEYS